MQPTFAANYLAIDVKPSPGGGLSEGTKAEIRLKDQAMFGFVSTLEKLRERALYMKREAAMEDVLRKDTIGLCDLFSGYFLILGMISSCVLFSLDICWWCLKSYCPSRSFHKY